MIFTAKIRNINMQGGQEVSQTVKEGNKMQTQKFQIKPS